MFQGQEGSEFASARIENASYRPIFALNPTGFGQIDAFRALVRLTVRLRSSTQKDST